MHNDNFEKIASQLAVCAVKRDQTVLPEIVGQIKQAAGMMDSVGQYMQTPGGKYLLGGLGGAGLGALIGAAQPKRKGRNALYYGALGGLGGLGLAHVVNSYGAPGNSDVQPNQPAPATGTPAVPLSDDAAEKLRRVEAPTNFDRVMDDPNRTSGQMLRAVIRHPLQGAARNWDETTSLLDEVGDVARDFSGYNGQQRAQISRQGLYNSTLKPLNDAVHDELQRGTRNYADNSKYLGEEVLYPAAKAVYDVPTNVRKQIDNVNSDFDVSNASAARLNNAAQNAPTTYRGGPATTWQQEWLNGLTRRAKRTASHYDPNAYHDIYPGM
jgi:hypothetical protein